MPPRTHLADALAMATGMGVARRIKEGFFAPYKSTDAPAWLSSTKMAYRGKRSRTRVTKKRRFSRRRFKARRRRTGTPMAVIRNIRTVTYWSPNLGAAGALSQAYLKLNSIYDPTGSLDQSQGYTTDQMSALYKRYQVMSYRVKLEVVSSDNTYPVVVGFTPLPESTALTAYAHYMELPGTVSRMCTMDVDKTLLYKTGRVNTQIVPGSVVSDDVLQGLSSSDPSRLLYGHIFAQVMDATTDAGTVSFIITLTQTTKFFDPVTVARSTI